jgi:hypothetical protein
MHNPYGEAHSIAGIAGGMLGTLLATVTSHDLEKTILLAATGAVVSFSVTFLLKRLIRLRKK